MNDSRDFEDTESVRSGQSHVTSQPVFSHFIQILGKFWVTRNNESSSIWDTHGTTANVCAKTDASSSAPYPQELNLRSSRTEESLQWKSNSNSRSEMSVWVVRQRFSHPQWRRLFKEIWSRPTTIANLRSSVWQIPHVSNVRLLDDKIQDWDVYLFTISYGSYAVDLKVTLVDSVDDLNLRVL